MKFTFSCPDILTLNRSITEAVKSYQSRKKFSLPSGLKVVASLGSDEAPKPSESQGPCAVEHDIDESSMIHARIAGSREKNAVPKRSFPAFFGNAPRTDKLKK